MENKHLGASFDDFLMTENIAAEMEMQAVKKVIYSKRIEILIYF
jgi:hypothetical protein